jgi:murein DD-endopeptidase MepM/ murein hydrolase activator NlpD
MMRMLRPPHRGGMTFAALPLALVLASASSLWPVASPHPLVRSFVAPASDYGAGHRGIDVAAPPGTPVLSPADGIVYFAGVVVDRPVLTISHEGGLLSSYEPVASTLAAGTPVRRGQLIGTIAAGGHCSAHCLHLGVRLHGQYVSPLNYLGGVTRPVLLPTRGR